MLVSVLKWMGGLAAALFVAIPTPSMRVPPFESIPHSCIMTVSLISAHAEERRLRIGGGKRPTYEVSKTVRVGRITAEVREYEPLLIAQSTVTGASIEEGTRKGFANIAWYMFEETPGGRLAEGHAVGPDVVAMTARRRKKQSRNVGMASPVRTEIMGSFRDMKVSFVMPRKFSATTLPAPRDKKVEIRSVPGHRMVAISFRGRLPNAAKLARISKGLFRALEQEGLTPQGGLVIHQYHHPLFTPGFLQRKEVAVQV